VNLGDPGLVEAISPEDFLALVDDRRDFHVPTVEIKRDSKKVRVPYVPAVRSWANTTGITLHQTACDLGESLERYDTIGSQWSITRSGKKRWHCDNNRIVYAANGFNNRTVSIEVNGLYAGDEARRLETTWDNPATKKRETPQDVTEESMIALRMVCRFICWDVMRHGGRIKFILAHRQSSGSRENDPGSEIWQRAAVPLLAELGLSDGGANFKVDDGNPIPECWDATRHKGVRY